MSEQNLDAAQIGKMFVNKVSFVYHATDTKYVNSKSVEVPAHWEITANLVDKIDRYHNSNSQTMTVQIEQGIGQKLAEVLLPAIVADASRKAQQLADDSRAMLVALGDRTIKCITDMPAQQSS